MHTININGISVVVPCQYRAQCFEDLLRGVWQNLSGAYIDNPLFAGLFEDSAILQWLADFLDQQVMRVLDADLKDKNNELLPILLEEPGSGRDHLARYLEIRGQPEGGFATYLFNRPGGLLNLLQRLTQNYQAAINRALQHIANDYTNLFHVFLASDEHVPIENYRLTKVVPTGSDLHKQGQQVLILEFTRIDDVGSPPIKVVYKPCSVLTNMLLMGDTRRLKEYGLYQACPANVESICEIINAQTQDTGLALPTYRVYPVESGNISASYGYVEYKSHYPWYDNDLTREIIAAGGEPPDYEDILTQRLNAALCAARDQCDEHNDYIIRTPEELDRYSHICGMLTGVCTPFGGGDLHCENLNVSGLLPYIIDAEVILQPFGLNAHYTCLFDETAGAMANDLSQMDYNYLDDISGMRTIKLSVVEKNCCYDFDTLQPCKLVEQQFNNGFARVLDIIEGLNDRFQAWLQQPIVQNMPIRIVPYITSDFQEWSQEYLWNNFDEGNFDAIRKKALLADLDKIFRPQDSGNDFLNAPNFCVLLNGGIDQDFRSLSIPMFCMRASETRLLNQRGEPIVCNYQQIANFLGIERIDGNTINLYGERLTIPAARDDYFLQSPVAHIAQQLMQLGAHKEQLKAATQQLIQKPSSRGPEEDDDSEYESRAWGCCPW